MPGIVKPHDPPRTGFINGMGPKRPVTSDVERVLSRRWGPMLLATLLIFVSGSLFYLPETSSEGVFMVDGDVNEWDQVESHPDPVGDTTPFSIPSMDIIDYRSNRIGGSYHLMVRYSDTIDIESSNRSRDDWVYLSVHIDVDDDLNTGQPVDGIGSDYMLEVITDGPTIVVPRLLHHTFDNPNEQDIWTLVGRATAAYGDDSLELSFPADLPGHDPSGPIRLSITSEGRYETTDKFLPDGPWGELLLNRDGTSELRVEG